MNYIGTFKGLRSAVLTIAVIFAFYGCEKPEGKGGTGAITGVVMQEAYNDDYSKLISKDASVDEEVFIMYGDEDVVGDRVFTSNSGAFAFEYLREGTYTLYYPSEDSTTVSREDEMLEIEVVLKNGEVKDLSELIQFKSLDFDDGNAKISGTVELINYKNSTEYPYLEIKDVTLAQNEDVYLVYGDHKLYDANVDTGKDGYFEFTNLIPGEYEVYLYSEDVTGGTEDIPVVKLVVIEEDEQVVDLGVITIEQL